ncbi:MAG: hypothetical protein HY560_01275 [Gemmatimonadetes bacterium]|nr:hypothetical protein [Gemmatimonadota bacterium]
MTTTVASHETLTPVTSQITGTVERVNGLRRVEQDLAITRDELTRVSGELDRVWGERDSFVAQRVQLEAERRQVVRDGGTATQLVEIDRKLTGLGRKIELATGATGRLERERETAKQSQDEARKRLEAARRRARELPEIVRHRLVYAMQRRAEADQVERKGRALRAGADQAQSQAQELRREYAALTGEELEVRVS